MTDTLISLENEIWKPVVGYEDYYEVSNIGRIKSVDRFFIRNGCAVKVNERIRKQCKYNGYWRLTLNIDGTAKVFKVHRLVALAFLGPSDLFIDHINDDRGDNRVENLRYVTNRENNKHVKNHEKNLNPFLNIQKVKTRKGTVRYSVIINSGPNRKWVGNFDTIELAVAARNDAILKYI